MPEAVKDRCTKTHETIFLLSKSPKYFYDNEAVKEQAAWTRRNSPEGQEQREATNRLKGAGNRNAADGGFTAWQPEAGRNLRSVWTVNPQPSKLKHYAMFPEKLIEPMILAGSRLGDTVLDPFAGAGTTGVVATRLGRSFIGVELNPEYIGFARERLAAVEPAAEPAVAEEEPVDYSRVCWGDDPEEEPSS
jgi:DNA modification methylase